MLQTESQETQCSRQVGCRYAFGVVIIGIGILGSNIRFLQSLYNCKIFCLKTYSHNSGHKLDPSCP